MQLFMKESTVSIAISRARYRRPSDQSDLAFFGFLDNLPQTPQRYGLSATAFFSSSRTYSGLMTSTL